MKFRWKNSSLRFKASLWSVVVLFSFVAIQGCSREDDLVEQVQTVSQKSMLIDSQNCFEELVVQNMENTDLDFEHTLYPGEYTPQWDEAYSSTASGYEYMNVPILSEYQFSVRKNIGTLESPKTRHVGAEQLLSFRKANATGNMQAMYLTFVPTAWYFDRNKNNVIESFYTNENNGNFSGYILYSSARNLNLQIVECYKDGLMIERATRSTMNLADFISLFGQMINSDVFIKNARFRLKSSTEGEDDTAAHVDLGEVEVVGDAPDEEEDSTDPDCGYAGTDDGSGSEYGSSGYGTGADIPEGGSSGGGGGSSSSSNNNVEGTPGGSFPSPIIKHEYTVLVVNGKTYVLVKGNWILQAGTEGQAKSVNGTDYIYYNGRWRPMYSPSVDVLKQYYTAEAYKELIKGGVAYWAGAGLSYSGVGTLMALLVGGGEAGLTDANYFMSRYYTEGERSSIYQKAVELTNQLRLEAGGLDE
ncbi:hypothetical protein [Mangrovibacterium marinum]|uniref:Uncharacterized protein n=1 Tax=Mangrovibacterium marinum TaxID=1639118 RepID=A0A2T5C1M7_9BACT|nr:hypothetical protein [Mangrovibacterium marinum]PTN08545.1 hypothetical protein C8N47_108102 [Mangrovibacterium marinum]